MPPDPNFSPDGAANQSLGSAADPVGRFPTAAVGNGAQAGARSGVKASKSTVNQPLRIAQAADQAALEMDGLSRESTNSTVSVAMRSAPRANQSSQFATPSRRLSVLELLILLTLVIMFIGLAIGNFWVGFAGALVALVLSLQIVGRLFWKIWLELISPQERLIVTGLIGLTLAGFGLVQLSGWGASFIAWYQTLNWDAIGATGEVGGAVGQILIAVLAVYIAWRQYVISKDLTIQQNSITQQQTIDSYFQGISELVLDEEGLLEDWPQERAIAEGRTAAILSSVDANGKAKVLRFLSRSRLLSPLQRDRRLGRAILDGKGGYAEDRNYGVRVVDLGVMLAGADLSSTDLRWTDLSDINLIRANLRNCDLVKANLARTILCNAVLAGSDLMGTRLFYGPVATASPRSRADLPDYSTGAYTGAVVEGADLTGVQRLSEEQRYYCCAWGGATTRATVPGGCEGIPNLLEDV
jgi:uncharacterized protein YjbI with pentapeptide repeats